MSHIFITPQEEKELISIGSDIRDVLTSNALADLKAEMDDRYFKSLCNFTLSNQTEFVGVWYPIHKPTYGVI